MKTIVTLSVLLLSLACCNLTPPATGNTKLNETYGPHARNKMDVYLPNVHDTTTKVVVLIHGGGWVAGSKSDWAAEVINLLKAEGYAVATINYRYADGDFHHQMNDVEMALDYMNSKAASWKIGTNRFALIGGSAGAHMSLLYAHGFDSVHQVKAVVSLAGPADMSDPLFHLYANLNSLGYVFEQFLGATIQNNPQVYEDASPMNYHQPTPTLLLHGSLDYLVPASHSQMMFDTLHAYGITADTTFFGNAGHEVMGTNGVNKNQIYAEIKTWLQLYLH